MSLHGPGSADRPDVPRPLTFLFTFHMQTLMFVYVFRKFYASARR